MRSPRSMCTLLEACWSDCSKLLSRMMPAQDACRGGSTARKAWQPSPTPSFHTVPSNLLLPCC